MLFENIFLIVSLQLQIFESLAFYNSKVVIEQKKSLLTLIPPREIFSHKFLFLFKLSLFAHFDGF